ncbi:nucleotide sugar dehydrogenase [Vulgatibacter incomptus]|uniref:UDP-glucose dehydrogenase n=1 Tax=Vulgatibacter incomptus TaxID=1391653 RepID=A0A0K1PJ22_9BACT|nr:nucleotide sugar dehydrogenase [Vulgatibacter incomptus]AKU93104.1 UDP-glucose dehydrogenase [Vulgatibacter incomptus]
MNEKIGVVGLGYVGLPVALAFAKEFPTVGFDISERRVSALREGRDPNGETAGEELQHTSMRFTTDAADLSDCTFFVVAVPTPVDSGNRPDLTPVIRASETLGKVLKAGAVVVYESTVFPGCTEEICGPVLARTSGLRQGADFKLGYSPERINPGDKKNTFETVTKIVSGEDGETLERVAAAYEAIVPAGVFRAANLKAAEAAKVIENAQRDINIAFMNEVAHICDRIGIRTADVIAGMNTKWNALRFTPGLVGGHCIGVDPYYITSKSEELGYFPEVILSGRRINNGMGAFIAQRLMKMLAKGGKPISGAKVGVLGLTFKENVSDLRNSRVPDIISELKEFGVEVIVHDAFADTAEAQHEYGIELSPLAALRELDGLVVAVSHKPYLEMPRSDLLGMLKGGGGALIDVKSIFEPKELPASIAYWSL